jgi:ubiquinone/menaquinone biosynthesis C-methylase UbiE
MSARFVSLSADSADPPGLNDYDSFAEGYTASNETSFVNAYYERPAMLALAGDVAGRRILDAGCGSGPLFAALRNRGAVVTGIDKSAGMLEQARRRLGNDANLQVAELGSPLPFPDGTFDDVTASLVLHYLEDWEPALAELRRVLKPGGRLIVSVNHPFRENLWHREADLAPDYFATYNYTVEWTAGGQSAVLRFWTRVKPPCSRMRPGSFACHSHRPSQRRVGESSRSGRAYDRSPVSHAPLGKDSLISFSGHLESPSASTSIVVRRTRIRHSPSRLSSLSRYRPLTSLARPGADRGSSAPIT